MFLTLFKVSLNFDHVYIFKNLDVSLTVNSFLLSILDGNTRPSVSFKPKSVRMCPKLWTRDAPHLKLEKIWIILFLDLVNSCNKIIFFFICT